MAVDPSAVTAAEGGTPAAPAKDTVGKYRLDRVIGAGGMGIVWAAFDPDLERSVALKLLRVEASEPTLRTRLLREARAMAKLRHPNVVTVFDVGTDAGRDYIAMELVDGGTLDEWLQTKPAQSAIIEALLAAGRGLAAAHNAGLVHRDFKPHNVLRASDGHIYVTDFGLARGLIEEGPAPVPIALPVDEELASGSQPRRARDFLDSTLTQTGVLIGTPAYMAPEQFGGGMPGPKSDQFAFCVTAWQCLTGERPFRGGNVAELEAAAKGGASKVVADLSKPLRAVLERGLDPSPEARWPDMPALLAALAAAVEPPRAEPRPRKRRRWLLAAIGGAVVLGGGGVLGMMSKHAETDECVPAEEAFASAWGPERRTQVKRTLDDNDEDTTAVLIMLDMIKGNWMRSYTAACDAPKTRAVEQRIRCLLDFRDQLASTANSELDTASVGGQFMSLGNCDPSASWNRFGPQPPLPPVPPAPAVPHAVPEPR